MLPWGSQSVSPWRGTLAFAVVSLTAVSQSFAMEGGEYLWLVTACLPVDVKRFASRSLKNDEPDADIKLYIDEARSDLVVQVGLFFIQDETKDSIMVIATAGKSYMPHICTTYHDCHIAGPY
ncbi:hypothetical protein EDB19DRAFT_1242771 [Suillus lakei]|nr:hypothetical protein EDB19DRAFT_1242771 [Suillus lakei]